MKKLYMESKNRTAWQLNRIKMKVKKVVPINVLHITGYGSLFILGLWGIASYINIIGNNLDTCEYASWNLVRFFL
jgi:hypothetical protein